MSNADIFVEMIRLGEQIGKVASASMYDNGFAILNIERKDGKQITMSIREDDENA